ncbi:MAG TPA: transglutaminase family protein, partial [Casimicrobiaceae bacterium]|nr:transglutaminase family protein [Casimicrobiaceae bacterium]
MPVDAGDRPTSRLRLEYSIGLHYDVFAPTAFALNVHAAKTPQQHVLDERVAVEPAVDWRVETEPASGNRLLRLVAAPGALDVRYDGTVEVTQHLARPDEVVAGPVDALPAKVLPYLLASRYCQVDQVQALAWREFGDMAAGFAQAEAVCRYVHGQVEFRVGTSTVETSALETLEQGVGVCRDFVHVAIAMLRALNYPARFVTGVDYGAPAGLGPPDFHSYVEAYIGDRWWLFDPTGITPLTGLIRIGTGRDAADVAFATMFGNVRGGMPKVAFAAVEDPAERIGTPQPTKLAVST